MRKTIGFVLFVLGAALLAVGVVTTTWAPGVVKQTPLDVDTTTRLEGQGARLDAETGELGQARPVRVTSVTQVDSDASGDDVAVFVQYQCVVYTDQGEVPDCPAGKDERIFTIPDPDKFATDRKTALAVDEDGHIPDDQQVVQHDGLVNKFPFDTEEKEYPYWDGLTEQAWPAVFVENEDVQGVEARHFTVTIEDEAVDEVAPDLPGTYSNKVDIWVEPRTGAILRQEQDQQRYLEDGTQVVDLQVAFTDEQIDTFVSDAEDNIAQLDLVTKTMPLVGFIGGGLLLLAGVAVLLLGRRSDRSDRDDSATSPREPVRV